MPGVNYISGARKRHTARAEPRRRAPDPSTSLPPGITFAFPWANGPIERPYLFPAASPGDDAGTIRRKRKRRRPIPLADLLSDLAGLRAPPPRLPPRLPPPAQHQPEAEPEAPHRPKHRHPWLDSPERETGLFTLRGGRALPLVRGVEEGGRSKRLRRARGSRAQASRPAGDAVDVVGERIARYGDGAAIDRFEPADVVPEWSGPSAQHPPARRRDFQGWPGRADLDTQAGAVESSSAAWQAWRGQPLPRSPQQPTTEWRDGTSVWYDGRGQGGAPHFVEPPFDNFDDFDDFSVAEHGISPPPRHMRPPLTCARPGAQPLAPEWDEPIAPSIAYPCASGSSWLSWAHPPEDEGPEHHILPDEFEPRPAPPHSLPQQRETMMPPAWPVPAWPSSPAPHAHMDRPRLPRAVAFASRPPPPPPPSRRRDNPPWLARRDVSPPSSTWESTPTPAPRQLEPPSAWTARPPQAPQTQPHHLELASAPPSSPHHRAHSPATPCTSQFPTFNTPSSQLSAYERALRARAPA